MPLRTVKGLWKRIGVQLTIWYSFFFIVSSIALFALSYFLLSTSLQQKDKDFVVSRLNEYTARYESVGLADTIKEIDSETHVDGHDEYLVRLADPKNKTIYKTVPDIWAGFNLTQLEEELISKGTHWSQLKDSKNKDVVDIASRNLADGHILQIGLSSEDRRKILDRYLGLFASVMIAIILIGFIGGSLAAIHVLRPIRNIINTTRTIVDTGKMEARVPGRGTSDELDELASLFNKMLEKIEILVRGMREALDNVAHDLRTPLTRLRNIAETTLQSEKVHASCETALADCLEESEHVLTMLKTMMDISEAEIGTLKLNLKGLDVSQLIEEVAELYQHISEEKNIRITLNLSHPLPFLGDPSRMRQVFANLLDNAIKYTPNNGNIKIQAAQSENQIVISFNDTGMGISQQDLPKIWDRLYRGDQSRSQKGLGLGLSLVKAIVTSHQGTIDVLSKLNEGSTFVLTLPLLIDSQTNSYSLQPI